jgi:hypothetical protein
MVCPFVSEWRQRLSTRAQRDKHEEANIDRLARSTESFEIALRLGGAHVSAAQLLFRSALTSRRGRLGGILRQFRPLAADEPLQTKNFGGDEQRWKTTFEEPPASHFVALPRLSAERREAVEGQVGGLNGPS